MPHMEKQSFGSELGMCRSSGGSSSLNTGGLTSFLFYLRAKSTFSQALSLSAETPCGSSRLQSQNGLKCT